MRRGGGRGEGRGRGESRGRYRGRGSAGAEAKGRAGAEAMTYIKLINYLKHNTMSSQKKCFFECL